MAKKWYADGQIKNHFKFTQADLPAYLGDAERFGWKTLNLHSTQIWKLPDSIEQLSNLQTLGLGGTQIGELPDSIGQLSNLQTLSLSHTQIVELPASIGQLSKLRTLYLRGTQIVELPANIGRLSNLQTLELSDTQIGEIPDSIGQLSKLRTLDLRGCHLKEIPYGVVKLGLRFVIDGNFPIDNCVNLTDATLDEGDITLFAKSRELIEAYYRNRVREVINECKVIFLGDGEAGKSSLIERIVNGGFLPGALPTNGVKMTKWETALDGAPFTLRFLDFGGQEIMHSMHRCFLTEHTVYVIVCASRDDTEIDEAAARWLSTVRSFSKDCPVILALNKADLNPNVSVNERDLKRSNPALKSVLKTSAAVDGKDYKFGAERLLKAILEQVPACIQKMSGNRDFLGLKRTLEEMQSDEKDKRKDYLTPDEFRAECEKFKIEESLRGNLLDWFQDLGVAYTYKDPFQNWYVLNPAWLTNGIYRLILCTPEGGFLKHSEIQEKLGAKGLKSVDAETTYSPEEMNFILYVMHQFEISHEIRPGVEMMPLKMPKTPPESVEAFPKENALHLRWEGAYLPKNLVHRLLIQKVQELDTSCVWRTGGRFRQEGGGCEALVEMNAQSLDMYVAGERDCRQYMETFRVKIQRILYELNLQTSEIICRTVDGREAYISYEYVLQLYDDGKDSVLIPDTRTYANPADLLRDTHYNWPEEAALYRERMERAPVNVNLTVNHNSPAETPDSPLDEKKTSAEIENILEDTRGKRIKNIVTYAAIVALAILAFVGNLDTIRVLLDLIAPFLGAG